MYTRGIYFNNTYKFQLKFFGLKIYYIPLHQSKIYIIAKKQAAKAHLICENMLQ